jgi:hypothetical protein
MRADVGFVMHMDVAKDVVAADSVVLQQYLHDAVTLGQSGPHLQMLLRRFALHMS